jgi:protein required for attachment to host cells
MYADIPRSTIGVILMSGSTQVAYRYGLRAAIFNTGVVTMNHFQTATHALVADGGTARLLCVTGPLLHREIADLEKFDNPSAHLHVHELVSDHQGRSFESTGHGGAGATHSRHGVGSDYDPHVTETEHYVARIAERLIELHRAHKLTALVLIAEPRLLGVMRARFPVELHKLIVGEKSGDYVHADHRQLQTLIESIEESAVSQR